MENLDEKGKVAEKEVSGIKEGRLKALKEGYKNPVAKIFIVESKELQQQCSDMASYCGGGGCGTGYAYSGSC